MVDVKIGLEIHQQLDTKKLFCDCPSTLSDESDTSFERFLRVTEGEMGEVDRAALFEYAKGKKYIYYSPRSSSCLVEMDEEPPHSVNEEALEAALTISKMVGAKVVDLICFMRKIVVDGSNTSGFQRTALVATDGEVNGVGIATICLEEDSARKIGEESGKKYYNIDRLGIPLIEMATKPEIKTPEMAQEIALKIGMILKRVKTKRGLGTIRQDLNVSISGMPKVEIKGFQRLNQISRVIQNEIERQKNLLEIKDALSGRVTREDLTFKVVDLTGVLSLSKSEIVKNGLKEGKKCVGIKLEGFRDLLSRGGELRIAKELMGYAEIRGMFHGDELPGYGIDREAVAGIAEGLKLGKEDSYVIVLEEEEKAKGVLLKIFERALLCFDGVVPEVRKTLDSCLTEYMRPMPGSERMYPETDVPVIPIDQVHLSRLKIPETPEARILTLRKLGANEQQSIQLLNGGYDEIFEDLVDIYGEEKVLIRTLLNTIPELEDVGLDTSAIDVVILSDVMAEYKRRGFGKEAIPSILKAICETRVEVSRAIKEIGLETARYGEVEAFIEKIVEESEEMIRDRGNKAFKPLMGNVMKKYRGKIDGKVLSVILAKKLEEVIHEGKG